MSDFLEDDALDDLYQEDELVVEEQDLRIIKGIVTEHEIAREFASSTDNRLFMGDARAFADSAIAYYKKFNSLPTRRVMMELTEASPDLNDATSEIWDRLDRVEFKKSEFNYDLAKIKQRYTQQKIASMHQTIQDGSDIDDVLLNIKRDLDDAEQVRRGQNSTAFTQRTMRDYIQEFRADYVEKQKNPEKGRGIMTNYAYLDYVTNGLSPSDMLIIGGQTGSGKSMFLSNMAVQMWMQQNTICDPEDPKIPTTEFTKGYNIQYFSLEMPFDQCFRRAFARIGALPTYGLRDARISDPDMLQRMSHAAKFIKEYPYEFEIVDIPRGVTVKDIEDRFLDSVARGIKPDILVVDYLGLMQDPKSDGDDWLRLGNISGELHELARMYDIVMLSAVQLNRPSTRKPEDAIGMHRIGRSSLIMHHASIGVQIETRKDEDAMKDLKYHVIKNRNGERGNHLLKKDFRTATVCDLDEGYKPKYEESSFKSNNPGLEDISQVLDNFGWSP